MAEYNLSLKDVRDAWQNMGLDVAQLDAWIKTVKLDAKIVALEWAADQCGPETPTRLRIISESARLHRINDHGEKDEEPDEVPPSADLPYSVPFNLVLDPEKILAASKIMTTAFTALRETFDQKAAVKRTERRERVIHLLIRDNPEKSLAEIHKLADSVMGIIDD